MFDGKEYEALVDTGCSQTIISKKLVPRYENGFKGVQTVDKRIITNVGEKMITLTLNGEMIKVKALVLERVLFDIIIGMDILGKMKEIVISEGRLGIYSKACTSVDVQKPEPLVIEDTDFEAHFNGDYWTISWKWKDSPPTLKNKKSCYQMTPEVQKGFDDELEKWIKEGWLKACEKPENGVIPMLAIEQPTKNKIRPVLDFRELNDYVKSFPGDSKHCDETLRRWRSNKDDVATLDLEHAYLQVRVDEKFWKYQVIHYKGKYYKLTRLGFGLNSAPKIMSTIVAKVLSLDIQIGQATDNYIDDIYIDKSKVEVEQVIKHLRKYGLNVKDPKDINGSKVLGLTLKKDHMGQLKWSRGGSVVEPQLDSLSKRELFSICGKLIGHYPVVGWLRCACSYIKRNAPGEWDNDVGEETKLKLKEVFRRIRDSDPVKGVWTVSTEKMCNVWCDSSSIAYGVVLETNDGNVIEDASWLRKEKDLAHINMAELDAVLKGINLALKWNFKNLKLLIDSATVYGWLQSILTKNRSVKCTGISEVLIKRRLAIVEEILEDNSLKVVAQLVKSEENKADKMTRVPKEWLRSFRHPTVEEIHKKHHFGVDRTWYFCKMVNSQIKRSEVEDVVRRCKECRTVDPSPVSRETGDLSVENNWERLAIDVTHFERDKYLTIVDSGPSRFSIWKKIQSEESSVIANKLDEVFREHGIPKEIICDNALSFKSGIMKALCQKWGVKQLFRCAFMPQGNGICERNHRTIKALATRSRTSPLDIVFWYNNSPQKGTKEDTVPSSVLFNHKWRLPAAQNDVTEETERDVSNRYRVGEIVYVKPKDARCTDRWSEATVTGVNNPWNFEIDGVPRHIADIRPVVEEANSDVEMIEDGDFQAFLPDEEIELEGEEVRRSVRERRLPSYLDDYNLDFR